MFVQFQQANAQHIYTPAVCLASNAAKASACEHHTCTCSLVKPAESATDQMRIQDFAGDPAKQSITTACCTKTSMFSGEGSPDDQGICMSLAVAKCTPLVAAASCDRNNSLFPVGLNLALAALSMPSVKHSALGLLSEVVLFLHVKGTLTL